MAQPESGLNVSYKGALLAASIILDGSLTGAELAISRKMMGDPYALGGFVPDRDRHGVKLLGSGALG